MRCYFKSSNSDWTTFQVLAFWSSLRFHLAVSPVLILHLIHEILNHQRNHSTRFLLGWRTTYYFVLLKTSKASINCIEKNTMYCATTVRNNFWQIRRVNTIWIQKREQQAWTTTRWKFKRLISSDGRIIVRVTD
jgi:hypothetical protein